MASNEPIGYRIVTRIPGGNELTTVDVLPADLFAEVRRIGEKEPYPCIVVAPYYEVDEGPTHYTPTFYCMPVESDPQLDASLYVRNDFACCCVQSLEGFWAEEGNVLDTVVAGARALHPDWPPGSPI